MPSFFVGIPTKIMAAAKRILWAERAPALSTDLFYTKDFLCDLIVRKIAYIGDFSYGNIHTLGEESLLVVGKYCSIAENCTVFLGYNHRVDWISTYPFNAISQMPHADIGWNASAIVGHPSSKGDVVIGNDVWIGYDVTIMSGVTIHDGAVVGADSLVTKNIPPYAIVGGNPAKIIKYRFSQDVIDKLLEIAWWNWDRAKVKEYIPLLMNNDVEIFIKACMT